MFIIIQRFKSTTFKYSEHAHFQHKYVPINYFLCLTDTHSNSKTQWPNSVWLHVLILQTFTGTLPTSHTHTMLISSPSLVISLSSKQSPLSTPNKRSALCSADSLAHKSTRQKNRLRCEWNKRKRNNKEGKQKLGQKQLKSQISGSVNTGAVCSWGSGAGSGGRALFCSQTTKTPLLRLHFFASLQPEDADQD